MHFWMFLNLLISSRLSSASEKRCIFDDIQEDEIEVLQQMFFGVVLCALATLAVKGHLAFTSIFMGADCGHGWVLAL